MAEHVLASGHADMVSMARPMLADPEFVLKASVVVAMKLIRVLAVTKLVSTTFSL